MIAVLCWIRLGKSDRLPWEDLKKWGPALALVHRGINRIFRYVEYVQEKNWTWEWKRQKRQPEMKNRRRNLHSHLALPLDSSLFIFHRHTFPSLSNFHLSRNPSVFFFLSSIPLYILRHHFFLSFGPYGSNIRTFLIRGDIRTKWDHRVHWFSWKLCPSQSINSSSFQSTIHFLFNFSRPFFPPGYHFCTFGQFDRCKEVADSFSTFTNLRVSGHKIHNERVINCSCL